MGLTNVIQQSSLVLVLLLVQISTGYSRASFTVIRDQQDRFEIPNIAVLPFRSSCGAHYCTCDPEYGTFVSSNNGGQLNVDCLSDQKLIERDRQSCTGFYQFHNGDLMRLLNMEVNSERKMTVNVPVNESTTCQLKWENSLYSYDGSNWFNFTNHVEQFDQIIEGTSNSNKILVFRLTNVGTFFQKWNSTLLKLKLECYNENNMTQREDGCVLFKVNGTFEQEYILTTLPTNSTNVSTILTTQPFTSTPTKSRSPATTEATNCVTCGRTEEQSDSISSQTTIMVVLVVVAVLGAVAIVTIILCRRKRPKDSPSPEVAAETAAHSADMAMDEEPKYAVPQHVQNNGNVEEQYMNISDGHRKGEATYENSEAVVSPRRLYENVKVEEHESEYLTIIH